jgi:4-hydroxybenzoate polyprenyltransferase
MAQNKLATKLSAYASLMRLNRPIGILLLLWPTLWALWVASHGHPSVKLVCIFIAGVVLMRSAGCVINDYFDRGFDGQVTRTKLRPLVTRQISVPEALSLFALLCLASSSLLWMLTPLARWLAIPAIAITILYPYMKRITHLPQLVLGVAFSWGIPMAFAAQANHIPGVGWLLFLIACLWPVAYDTIYAMVDRADDLLAGIKSTAILWGNRDTQVIAGLHLLMLVLLVLLGVYLSLGEFYYLALSITAAIMCYLQYLIKDRVPTLCFKAFLASHWVGAAIFIGLVYG